MIIADTGAVIALIDRGDVNHQRTREMFESTAAEWVLPWAILPEVDYIVGSRLGATVASAFRSDLADGAFAVEWAGDRDLARARELNEAYEALSLGLVDGVVMAMAERLQARAIVTFDLRDFGPVALHGSPALWPRDL